MSTGMICDGIAASEAIDSSGEILDIAGCDISDFEEGRGTINWEHRGDDASGASANDIVGRILFAKKIFSPEDCTDSRQLQYYQELQLPYIYIIYRLFDGSAHPGAVALAAIIRDCKKNGEKNLIGLSIEGTTLKKDGNRLLRSVARRVAATQKPCNKSALSNVISDPGNPEVQKNEHPHPLFTQLTDAVASPTSPLVESDSIRKALDAGSYNAAPGALTGGSALQVEDRSLRNRIKAAVRDWDRKTPFKKFLKHRLPEASDDFLDRFSGLAEDYTIRKAQRDLIKAAVKQKVMEKVQEKTKPVSTPKTPKPQKTPAEPKQVSLELGETESPLTIRGRPVAPNPQVKRVSFDEATGTLHTPRGSFPMYIPSRDTETPDAGQKFHNIMNDPKVSKFHDYAMENWSKLHQHLKAGTVPPEVVMHGVLFSQLSPNCLDAETEALTQRGWVPGFELTTDDVLLTKNQETGKLEWHKPKDLRFFPDYDGDLIRIQSRSFDVVTTPDHRWLVTTPRGHQKIYTSQELTSGCRIHRTGLPLELATSALTDDEASLLGWFVTDGFYQRPSSCNQSRASDSRSKFETPGIYAFLCQSSTGNPEKCKTIDSLIERLGGCTSVRVDSDGKRVWNLGPRLTKLLLARAPDRHLRTEALLDLGRTALESLRDAMFLGDGNSWKNGKWAAKKQLTTGNREQAEAFQALLALTGQASSVVYRDMSKYTPRSEKLKNVPKMTGVWIVTALNRKYVNFDARTRSAYRAKTGVWCPIVPNEVFVARRKGQVFCTLNTPVPMQELMYAHLVDAMKATGADPRTGHGMQALRSDWLQRDRPQEWPEHSREHFQRLEGQLRLKRDAKGTDRKEGDIGRFMLANNKFKNMDKYSTLHDGLMELVGRHRHDARSAVAELMHHKGRAKLWEAKRNRDLKAGKPDPGDYTAGPDVPGLATKTARYTYGMLGGGNVTVPDTHFSRYLFGLDRKKDADTIKYLRDGVLWNENNAHIMGGLDRYYAQHHDAVQHMLQNPKWKHVFESPEDAVFPAFWKNWVGIVPHEAVRGMKTNSWNESTDHRPFWEAVGPYLQKSEADTNLAARTARTHHEWVQKYGEMPAMLMYFHYLVPQLLDAASRREQRHTIAKFESLAIDLLKGDSWRAPAWGDSQKLTATREGQIPSEPGGDTIQFNGKTVRPGKARLQDGSFAHLLDHSRDSYTAVPADKLDSWAQQDLIKLPRMSEDVTFKVLQHPEHLEAPSVISHEVHTLPEYTHHPETQTLVHGLDLSGDKEKNSMGINRHSSFWTKNAEGKRVYVKTEEYGHHQNNTHFSDANREALYHNLARDFYGLGQYVVPTTAIVSPRTGEKLTVTEHTPGEHYQWRNPQHKQSLDALRDSGELGKIAIMNAINHNDDRHEYNYLLSDAGGVKLIDHGRAFGTGQPMTPFRPHYLEVGSDYDTPVHQATSDWLLGLKPEELNIQMLRHRVPSDIVNETRRRLKAMQDHVFSARARGEEPRLFDTLSSPFKYSGG